MKFHMKTKILFVKNNKSIAYSEVLKYDLILLERVRQPKVKKLGLKLTGYCVFKNRFGAENYISEEQFQILLKNATLTILE